VTVFRHPRVEVGGVGVFSAGSAASPRCSGSHTCLPPRRN